MAEFVEKALEQLLPIFEQLKLVELYTPDEVDKFIKICRAFEYKLAKRTKAAKDFLGYANYLKDQLALVEKRRKETKYAHRYDQIERPLKDKCAFLYRICTQRFKKLEYHEQEVAFLHGANMMRQCSQAYTRLLQFYGHLPENYVKACRFEFFDNHSAENGRTIAMVGLRKFPQFTQLWATHFEIELRYVAQLLLRRNFLLTKPDTDKSTNLEQKPTNMEIASLNNMDDELLQLKLARIVYEMAMNTIEDRTEKKKLVLQFLQITQEHGTIAADLLHDLNQNLEEFNLEETNKKSMLPDEELFEFDTQGTETTEEEEFHQQEPNKTNEMSKKQGGKKTKRAVKSVLDGFNMDDPELKKLLSRATLTGDYDQKPLDEVLITSQRKQKKTRMAERQKTAGHGWFDLPAMELDEEKRRDLELINMRDALNPKEHYKKPDREILPKYFQIGHIVESKADFYSARIPKNQRKRTFAEELMADHETIARNKKRYSKIIQQKETTNTGAFRRKGRLPKQSKRKFKTKSH